MNISEGNDPMRKLATTSESRPEGEWEGKRTGNRKPPESHTGTDSENFADNSPETNPGTNPEIDPQTQRDTDRHAGSNPEIPERKVPEMPDRSVPEVPDEPIPEAPDRPEPEVPGVPDPDVPEQPEPEKPTKPASSAGEEADGASEGPDHQTETGETDGTGDNDQDGGEDLKQRRPRNKISITLIDDEEEQQKNSSYDEFDQDEQEQEEEEERLNFGLLSKEDLVKLMREKLDNPARGNIRKDVEEIRQAFYDKVHAEQEEKKENFLKEGGDLEDFKPLEDPVEQEMKDLLNKYRALRAEFTRQLEKTKQENLEKKQEILEKFRILMEGQETFEITFRKFKDLQKQWFAAGVVPQQHLKDLWDSYNYFVDKFNDYVRINRELRALDLKKNLELKTQLCERTEKLQEEANVVQAFRALQKMHARWREIGPVPRENREELWERFKKATSVINKKHQEHHALLKESLHENLKKKTELCEKVEEIAAVKYDSHGAWADQTRKVLDIQKTWKTIGYAPKKDNNAIYARFRRACDVFFNNKAEFYSAAYEEQKENLKLKQEITEEAEKLSNSEDWKQTTHELIRLQKRWKEIGPVPRRESDRIWKRFRRACDTFFDRKQKYFRDADSNFAVNLKAKEDLIAEMHRYTPSDDREEDAKAVEEFQSRFNEIGFVPSSQKDAIREEFRKALESLLKRIGMGDSERSLFKFRNRVEGIIHSPRSDMKLNFERDKLVNKLQQLKNDIGLWENNIGFIKHSDSSEETIQEFHRKIESARQRIEVLEEKIRILDDMESAN